MLYTTRNPGDAFKFIDSLPIHDHDKVRLTQFFPVMTKLLEELKESKFVNAKGGERWFVMRLETKIQEAQETVQSMLRGMKPEDLAVAQFIASQNAVATATLELAKECKASPEVLSGINQYCEFMNELVREYMGM
jgi:hypothetical protein